MTTNGDRRLRLAEVVRVSQMGERKRDAESFHADEEQHAECSAYAQELGAELVPMEPELSVSGGRPIEQRPALKAAIEGVEAGIYDGIMAAYLSRLTRSRSGYEIWERVEGAGGRIYCARERLDTSTPTGRYVRDLHIANAVREREEAAVRFDNRVQASTEAGIWQRRQTPKGYDRGPDRRLVPNADAELVRWAFRERAAGRPLQQIADKLRMTRHGVSKLLRNRVYLGELHVQHYVNRKAHPTIVTADEFEAAQTKQSRPARGSQFDGPALLTGIVRCAGCGGPMSRHRGGALSYTCHFDGSSRGKCPAPAVVSCHLLDALVEPHGRAIMARLRAIAMGPDVDALRHEAEDADAEIAAYVALTKATTAGYAEGLRIREEDAAEKWQRYREALTATGAAERAASWDDLTVAERNAVLRGAGLAVEVSRAGGPGSRTPIERRVRITTDHGPAVLRMTGAHDRG